MFRGRLVEVTLVALCLAALIGATSPEGTTSAGTASTSMTAVEAAIEGLGTVPPVSVLDVATYASTDGDPARNERGGGEPFALASLVPIASGALQIGAVSASSDGQQRQQGSLAELGALGDLTAPLGIEVAPGTASAAASAEQALARVETVTGRVEALLGGVGMDLNVTEPAASVTARQAEATQGLSVSDISLGFGDLVGTDVLEQLPLGTILALLDRLPVDVSGDLEDVIDDVESALAALTDDLTAVEEASDALVATADGATAGELGSLQTQLSDLESDLADLESDLSTATSELTSLETELAELEALATTLSGSLSLSDVQGLLTDPFLSGCGVTNGDLLLDLGGAIGTLRGCVGNQITAVEAEIADLEAQIADLEGDVVDVERQIADLEDSIADLEQQLTDLVGTLDRQATALSDAVDDLLVSLGDLEDAAGSLESVVDEVLALLPDIAGTALVEIDAFDVGTTAVATSSIDTSRADFLCSALTVRVIGQESSTPSCSEGLETVGSAAATVEATFGQVEQLLGALPLESPVALDALRLDLFPDVVEEVSQDGDYVVARASGSILALDVPSLTVDPSAASSVLPGIDLPSILGPVQSSVDDAVAAVQDLGLGELSGVLGTLDQADSIISGGLSDEVSSLSDLLDGLDLGEFGSLTEPVVTPGLDLVIDPASTASFRPGTDGSPTDSEPTPDDGQPAPTGPGGSDPGAPSDSDQPDLPNTGGGAALLAVLALSAAFGLLRRRP